MKEIFANEKSANNNMMLAYLAILPKKLLKLTSPLRKYSDLLAARYVDALLLLKS
jgi:exoribonuclease II